MYCHYFPQMLNGQVNHDEVNYYYKAATTSWIAIFLNSQITLVSYKSLREQQISRKPEKHKSENQRKF